VRTPADLPELAEQFRLFARTAGRDGAPRYRDICEGVAGDPVLLELTAHAPADQRRPNILLAAVHYLLLSGAGGPLARHYPTVAEWRGGAGAGDRLLPGGEPPDPFPDFAAFAREHLDELVPLVATRATQTNEIGRCAVLLPALATVAGEHGLPLSLLDLGTSAGLNLLFDRYAYTYTRPDGPPVAAGDPASAVHLQIELRAGRLPDLDLPRISQRQGIDRHPIDPTDPDQALWLLACQWPDHLERFRRLAAALALARTVPDLPRIHRGDMVDDLGAMAADAPAESRLCILHTWAAAYLSPERQGGLEAAVDRVASTRPVSWLYAEHPFEVPGLPMPAAPAGEPVRGSTALVLVELNGARRVERRLADVHHHGRWLHWWG
jgi:hypothetical protein